MEVNVRLIGVSCNSEDHLRSPIRWLRSAHINGVKVEPEARRRADGEMSGLAEALTISDPEASGTRIKTSLIDRNHG
jgi:hypothetical protein